MGRKKRENLKSNPFSRGPLFGGAFFSGPPKLFRKASCAVPGNGSKRPSLMPSAPAGDLRGVRALADVDEDRAHALLLQPGDVVLQFNLGGPTKKSPE